MFNGTFAIKNLRVLQALSLITFANRPDHAFACTNGKSKRLKKPPKEIISTSE
jgi:hypothetical protein